MPSIQIHTDRCPRDRRGSRLAIAALMLAYVSFSAQAQDPGQRGGPVVAPPPPPDPAPPPPPPPPADASSLPRCSATVQDRCIQMPPLHRRHR